MSDLTSNITPVAALTAQPTSQSNGSNSLKINGILNLFNPAQMGGDSKQFMATLPRPGLVAQTFLQFRSETALPDSTREGTLYRIELDKTEELDGDDDLSEDPNGEEEDPKGRRARKEKEKKAKKTWQKARRSILASLQKKSKGITTASKPREENIFSLLSKKQK